MAATNVQAFSGDIQLPIGSSLTTNINDTFTHDGEQMPHVGLQWRTHTEFTGGQVGQLSAYKGFKFFTEGTEKVTILNDGKVGIGRTNPSDSFHVMGGISTQNGGNPAVTPQVLFRSGSSNTNSWQMKANISDAFAGDFTIDRLDASTPVKFVIKNDGKIGIGKDDPGTTLDVAGTITGSAATFTNTASGDGVLKVSNTSTPGVVRLVTSGGKVYFQSGTAETSDSRSDIRITSMYGATNYLTILGSNGNVGVNQTSPDAKFDVNGFIKGGPGLTSRAPLHISDNTLDSTNGVGYGKARFMMVALGVGQAYHGNEYGLEIGVSGSGNSLLQSIVYNHTTGETTASYNLGLQPFGGNVGVGTYQPGVKLDVRGPEIRVKNTDDSVAIVSAYGDSQGTGRLYVGQSSTYGGGIEYNGDNVPTSTGAGADYTTLYRVENGVYNWTARNIYNGNQWEFRTSINNSDDRVKENETYIRGATETLMKIKPQIYDKKPSIESTDTKEWFCESGLIAQELYYDVPELRHLVKIPRDARDIDTNVSITSDDPDVDPDYSAWGKDTSAINYVGLVPYLIKSVQEITTELPRHKTPVSNITPQNVNDFVGLIVSKRGSVELSTKSEDKACYGVISGVTCDTQNNEILINASGEGKIWVTNVNGNLEAGDLITTSNIVGYGQLQNSTVLSNFTVAKITEDCDFNPPSTPVRRIRQEMSNVTVYSVSREVRVTEEEYNELAEEDRTTENRITYFNGDTQIDFSEYSNLESNTLRTETTLVFKMIHRHTSRTMREGYTPEVRQELVNVLDEHGQLVWEDHPTETEKAYKIRYLDADGNITDEANAVHKAAFVGCTYHCG